MTKNNDKLLRKLAVLESRVDLLQKLVLALYAPLFLFFIMFLAQRTGLFALVFN